MKRILMITLCLVMFATAAAAQMGVSDGHDLDALLKRAQDTYDFDDHDAVLLLESREVEIWPHDDVSMTVHRVVWIGTQAGLRAHADLRIPWNSDTSKLEVEALRTWRDDRWWPSADTVSETAVVETLPYAVDRCPDYAGMRETMLLHDGVELPCIMETIYTITERGVAKPGVDGVFVMPQRDPTVHMTYRVTAPKIRMHTRSFNGAPEPVIEGNSRVWTMDDVPRLRLPATAHAVRYEPTLMWSTWYDRGTMLTNTAGPIYDAAVIDEALAELVSERVDGVASRIARARSVVDMLSDDIRAIHYDDTHWVRSVRTTERVWATAYGHDRDRAALALALFRAAGLTADLQLVSTDGAYLDDFPATALLDRTLVRIWDTDDTHLAVYDPAHGELRPASEQYGASGVANRAAVALHLRLTPADDGPWTGSGYYRADEILSPHMTMIGTGTEAADHLGEVLEGALAGATLTGHNPEHFRPEHVAMGLAFEIDPNDSNDSEDSNRIRIDLADLTGGLLDALPRDVRLEDAERGSPVPLRAPMRQTQALRIDLDGVTVIRAPEPRVVDNPAGRFELTVESTDDHLTITRTLVLAGSHDDPAAPWPDLRALLLEEVDPANRAVVLTRD